MNKSPSLCKQPTIHTSPWWQTTPSHMNTFCLALRVITFDGGQLYINTWYIFRWQALFSLARELFHFVYKFHPPSSWKREWVVCLSSFSALAGPGSIVGTANFSVWKHSGHLVNTCSLQAFLVIRFSCKSCGHFNMEHRPLACKQDCRTYLVALLSSTIITYISVNCRRRTVRPPLLH